MSIIPMFWSQDARNRKLSHSVRSPLTLGKAQKALDRGAVLDHWDACGMHPVHWATNAAYFDVECLEWAIDRGASVDTQVTRATDLQFHPIGWAPLHIAVHGDSLLAVDVLLARGADLNLQAEDGSTPLHVAALRYRSYKRLIRSLLDAGADPNSQDQKGQTALHLLASGSARYRKTAIRLLLSRSADITLTDNEGNTPFDLVKRDLPASPEIRRLLTPEAA